MKVLRVIRFDASDDRVYERAAPADEIAVPGGFAFAHLAEADIAGKTRQAFANGFLGLPSLGRATVVAVGEASEAEIEAATRALAEHFCAEWGAPDLAAALPVAGEELAFALELAAEKPVNTLIAVVRAFDEDGQVRERFREIAPPTLERPHTRIWELEPD